ncbi:hypothetical protein KW837_21970 [Pseudomonas sp. PDM24]|uniref:hypothetical protein n=1 Tax=Pseudomonas TaxID=286 RepID=UPI001C4657E4|nr:hypothetical protein [Pseudomonas sp. PDM24]MBV7496936.1 hypothetical protein [Pseudomonas sp. PDM24]
MLLFPLGLWIAITTLPLEWFLLGEVPALGSKWKSSGVMEVKRLADLHEVFVSFDTEWIEGCSIVYLNDSIAGKQRSGDILRDYSYMVKSASERHRDLPLKTFKAERYGGDGILGNGGGGRCGFDGVWQLKGLGPNQLVGKDSDAAHGDGNLCLTTAIYETLWSEIIACVLPFGAIRTVAILDTGREYETRGEAATRGLLVREPVVRPAHFIRAVYFKQKVLNKLGEDAERVKLAIARLADFLPSPATPPAIMNQRDRLESGLIELAGRYAEQFAAARAKHIAHYNVSASNLSLDGAWLDLSGACLFTGLSGHDRMSIDRYNNEYAPALESLQNLSYYLSKYSVITIEQAKRLYDAITRHFVHTYEEHLRLYQVAQVGFPLWALRPLAGSAELQAFSQSLRQSLDVDDFTDNALVEGGWSGYERWTAPFYRALVASKCEGAIAIDLSGLKADTQVTRQLLSRFSQLFDLAAQVAHGRAVGLRSFRRCMAINVIRLNRIPDLLHDLQARIEQIRERPIFDRKAAYQALTKEIVHGARLHLESEQGHTVPMWLSDTVSIEFEPMSGVFTLKTAHCQPRSSHALLKLVEDETAAKGVLSFYHGVWNILNE